MKHAAEIDSVSKQAQICFIKKKNLDCIFSTPDMPTTYDIGCSRILLAKAVNFVNQLLNAFNRTLFPLYIHAY